MRSTDYTRTAVRQGLPWYVVILKHALRSALLPAAAFNQDIDLRAAGTLGAVCGAVAAQASRPMPTAHPDSTGIDTASQGSVAHIERLILSIFWRKSACSPPGNVLIIPSIGVFRSHLPGVSLVMQRSRSCATIPSNPCSQRINVRYGMCVY